MFLNGDVRVTQGDGHPTQEDLLAQQGGMHPAGMDGQWAPGEYAGGDPAGKSHTQRTITTSEVCDVITSCHVTAAAATLLILNQLWWEFPGDFWGMGILLLKIWKLHPRDFHANSYIIRSKLLF